MGDSPHQAQSLKSHTPVVLPPQVTNRISGVAIILRTQAFGESDLIVDLFTECVGKISVIAKGAMRSKKRYMGTLEIGNRIKVDFLKKAQLSVLGECDIIAPIWRTRQDLDRIASLHYLLEIIRFNTGAEEADSQIFESLCHCLDLLESGHFTAESLAIWDLSMMKRMGYDLSFQKCPYTQLPPDGLSLKAGGTISAKANLPYYPVPIEALRVLYQLKQGQLVQIDPHHTLAVRLALGGIWGDICQNRIQSLGFFQTIDFQTT
jgi:DNA repair protein RecO (recombination protein O)